jgi:hypothetical protein
VRRRQAGAGAAAGRGRARSAWRLCPDVTRRFPQAVQDTVLILSLLL